MSYVRFNEDSDVYVYASMDGVIHCVDCLLVATRSSRSIPEPD